MASAGDAGTTTRPGNMIVNSNTRAQREASEKVPPAEKGPKIGIPAVLAAVLAPRCCQIRNFFDLTTLKMLSIFIFRDLTTFSAL